MELEKKIARFVSDTKFEDLPKEPINVAKNVVLTILGTTIVGATAEGCEAIVNQVKEWGGKEEATILIHGGKIPAYNAALANSVMARATDFCEAMPQGIHVGSSSVPTALASAELVGGCSGKEFLSALVLGTEVAARINSISGYDGFDPTGVCSIFAAAAVAGRILRLNSQQMLNALALAFNKAGGSLQSNIDGSLAVRMIQGFVSQGGIICAQLAQRGITGPRNFLEGIYGYFHLFAKNKHDHESIIGDIGKRFELCKTIFKRYPSCGCTLASTEAILEIVEENGITAEAVEDINITVTPYVYKLTGHNFEIGDNPTVNAQFNIQYCVANALLRRSPRLHHFEGHLVREPKIMELTKKIHIFSDPAAETRGRVAMDMVVRTRDGRVYHKAIDIPRGFPGNPLTMEEHITRFQDCLAYAGKPLPLENTDEIMRLVKRLEEMDDINSLIPLLIQTH
jgi:2-methylcitrate dehydratase PrpD